MKQPLPIPDPHFGDTETMLAWCKEENLPTAKNPDGTWNWYVPYEEYCRRLDSPNTPSKDHDKTK